MESLFLSLVRWLFVNASNHKFMPGLSILWYLHEFAGSHSGEFLDVVYIVCLKHMLSTCQFRMKLIIASVASMF